MHDERQTGNYSAEEFPELPQTQKPRPSVSVPNSLRAALRGVALDRAKAGHPTSRLRGDSADVAAEAPVSRSGANTVADSPSELNPSPSTSSALQNPGAHSVSKPQHFRAEPEPSRSPQASGNSDDSYDHGDGYPSGLSQGPGYGSVYPRMGGGGSVGGVQQMPEYKTNPVNEVGYHPEFEGAYFEIDGERYEYEDDCTKSSVAPPWPQPQQLHEQQFEYAEDFDPFGGDEYEQEQYENEQFERFQASSYGGGGPQDQYPEPRYNAEQYQTGQQIPEKLPEKLSEHPPVVVRQLSPAEKKLEANLRRMAQVVSTRELVCYENIRGMRVNILEGLSLHTHVFTPVEQQKLVDLVEEQQELGRKGMLKERTYSEPHKWMKGKGRITIQYGCCYNYATDKSGTPPGIARREAVDPLPERLKQTIARLVMWHILPPDCVPDSCIINIYEKDDCIPPHIDHHDFVRPFCTLSLLCTAPILFGSKLDIVGPGEFKGVTKLTLPPGSVLVLAGNGADVAKHCIPAVPDRRISITFRKMDASKVPHDFVPELELQNIVPLPRNRAPAPLHPPPPVANAWGAGPPKTAAPAPAPSQRGGATSARGAPRKVTLSAGAPSFVPGAVVRAPPPTRMSWADEAGS